MEWSPGHPDLDPGLGLLLALLSALLHSLVVSSTASFPVFSLHDHRDVDGRMSMDKDRGTRSGSRPCGIIWTGTSTEPTRRAAVWVPKGLSRGGMNTKTSRQARVRGSGPTVSAVVWIQRRSICIRQRSIRGHFHELRGRRDSRLALEHADE